MAAEQYHDELNIAWQQSRGMPRPCSLQPAPNGGWGRQRGRCSATQCTSLVLAPWSLHNIVVGITLASDFLEDSERSDGGRDTRFKAARIRLQGAGIEIVGLSSCRIAPGLLHCEGFKKLRALWQPALPIPSI